MAILGYYLVLKLDGEIIAESTNVNLKVIAKAMDRTSKVNGVTSEYMPGKVTIGIAGRYLVATNGANWQTLYDYQAAGTDFALSFYRNGVELFWGSGLLKKLSLRGGSEVDLITGTYGIIYTSTTVSITTEGGLEITTEDGQTLIIE